MGFIRDRLCACQVTTPQPRADPWRSLLPAVLVLLTLTMIAARVLGHVLQPLLTFRSSAGCTFCSMVSAFGTFFMFLLGLLIKNNYK